jgi:hypothetical protein
MITRLPYGIDTITVADHTDFGCITILLQELGSKGLEVLYPPTQTWIPIAPKEGAYVINMSDMMQKWTTGYYKSARHRVITTSDKDRYSVAFFLNGNLKLNTLALDGSGEEVLIGEHIRSRLVSTLGDTRHLIKAFASIEHISFYTMPPGRGFTVLIDRSSTIAKVHPQG